MSFLAYLLWVSSLHTIADMKPDVVMVAIGDFIFMFLCLYLVLYIEGYFIVYLSHYLG